MSINDAKSFVTKADYKNQNITSNYIDVLDDQYKSIAKSNDKQDAYDNSWSKRPKKISEFYSNSDKKGKKTNSNQLLDDAGYEAIDKFENSMGTSQGKSMQMGDGYSRTQEDEIRKYVEENIGMDTWNNMSPELQVQVYSFMFNHGTNDNVLKGLAQAINLN